jgi:hypothetical protein
MAKKLRRRYKFKLTNKMRHVNALFEKDWEMEPEGDETQIDAEFGVLPQMMEDLAKEEMKKLDAQDGGQQGGGGGAAKSSD